MEQTITLEELLDTTVAHEAKKALGDTSNPFWKGLEWFLDWCRTKVKDFVVNQLKDMPIVGPWAVRIGTSITELIFTVIAAFVNLMKLSFSSRTVWQRAHESAMVAWNANAENGLLAQTYAYGKKMAGYFLEIMLQCLERAIKAQGLEVSEEEKRAISSMLDELLP